MDKIEATVPVIVETGAKIALVMDFIAALIRLLAFLMLLQVNIFAALVNLVIDMIEGIVLDLLQNNIAACFHINLNFNADWKYRRGPNDVAQQVPDFVNDGNVPWEGTGLDGWLSELAESTRDVTDPFRPLTDADTKVGGMIFMKGIPDFNLLTDLKALLDAWTFWDDWKDLLDSEAKLKEKSEEDFRLKTLGAAMFSAFMDGLNGPFAGGFPFWMAVPLAALIPPLKVLFEYLRKLAELLRLPTGNADALFKLAELIERRADLVEETSIIIGEVILQVVAIIRVLIETEIIYLPPEVGGMDGFTSRAGESNRVGEDTPPYFGEDGIVAGLVLVATTDDLQNNIDKFLEALGIQVTNLTTEITERTDALDETYGSLFDEEEPPP
jgi:hypothetical protein